MKKFIFALFMLVPLFAVAAPSPISLLMTPDLGREDGSELLATDIKHFEVYAQKPGNDAFEVDPVLTVIRAEQEGPGYTATYMPDVIGLHLLKVVVVDNGGLRSVDSITVEKESIEMSPPKTLKFLVTITEVE